MPDGPKELLQPWQQQWMQYYQQWQQYYLNQVGRDGGCMMQLKLRSIASPTSERWIIIITVIIERGKRRNLPGAVGAIQTEPRVVVGGDERKGRGWGLTWFWRRQVERREDQDQPGFWRRASRFSMVRWLQDRTLITRLGWDAPGRFS